MAVLALGCGKLHNQAIRVLHVGAFFGNIGDYANHQSFYRWFSEALSPRLVHWSTLDLRSVWRGDRNLGKHLEGAGAQFDMIIFGGGNFWEMWDSTSRNGTSLNVSLEELRAEGLPVFFNCIGAEVERGVTANSDSVFRREFEEFNFDQQFLVTVRNDGSLKNLNSLNFTTTNTHVLPDHALFSTNRDQARDNVKIPKLLLNIANDLREVRFSAFAGDGDFVSRLAKVLASAYEETEFELQIFAQIPSDVVAGANLIEQLPQVMLRKSVGLNFPNAGSKSLLESMRLFDDAHLAVVTRFHSNIFALTSNSDVISISNHRKVTDMHVEIRTPDFHQIPINGPADFDLLTKELSRSRILESLSGYQPDVKFDKRLIDTQRMQVKNELISWLTSHSLI